MHRLLAIGIYAYVGISAAQWVLAARWLYAPPGGVLWCGNVVSDPYMILVNVVAPMAAVCAAIQVRRAFLDRRWSARLITGLIAFAITSASLVYESHVLSQYGISLGSIWWAPWR